MVKQKTIQSQQPGFGIDPTKNVEDLVNQEKERNNDLRTADEKLRDYQIANLEKIMNLHIMYLDKLSAKESDRIDAVNKVSAAAVLLANEKTNTTASLLANQLEQITTELSKRISAVETTMNVSLGKGSVSEPIIEQVLKEVKTLRSERFISTGEATGKYNLWTIFLGLVAAGASVWAIIEFIIP